MSSTAIVLAAGLGVRMKSNKPKVLHAAAGRPLIDHVVTNLMASGVETVRLVVGHGSDEVKKYFNGRSGVEFFLQKNQLGTADAVKSAQVNSLTGIVVIGNGDHPLIKAEDYKDALIAFEENRCDLMVVSSVVRDPTSFGRIVRESGKFARIIEEKEATESEKKIHEINSGLYVVKSDVLKKFLPLIENKNKKKEYYLTDLVALALNADLKVIAHRAKARVSRGVNNQMELAMATRSLFMRKNKELMENGVTIIDPGNTYIEAQVAVGAGTTIYPGCFIQGSTVIGNDCVIESHCQIQNSRIGNDVEIRWGSLVDQSEIQKGARVGPYARVRPESLVGENAHVGNFVELKKARLAEGVKANHLTYLGDVEIGENTNVGCGTITCNYAVDKKKYKTHIGKNVFIGSDTQLIAPVSVGDNAVIGSGSTITKDVPANALAVARGRQFIKENYKKDK